MNNISKIRQLLEKYFEGETSLEEEKILKTYFNGTDVAEDLKAYQGLFQFFSLEKSIIFPKRDTQTPPIYASQTVAPPNKIRSMYHQIAKIAAILLVAVCAYWLVPQENASQQQAINWEQYEVTDEKEALEKTIAALRLVSSKLNKSAKRAAKEVHHVQKAAKIFKK